MLHQKTGVQKTDEESKKNVTGVESTTKKPVTKKRPPAAKKPELQKSQAEDVLNQVNVDSLLNKLDPIQPDKNIKTILESEMKFSIPQDVRISLKVEEIGVAVLDDVAQNRFFLGNKFAVKDTIVTPLPAPPAKPPEGIQVGKMQIERSTAFLYRKKKDEKDPNPVVRYDAKENTIEVSILKPRLDSFPSCESFINWVCERQAGEPALGIMVCDNDYTSTPGALMKGYELMDMVNFVFTRTPEEIFAERNNPTELFLKYKSIIETKGLSYETFFDKLLELRNKGQTKNITLNILPFTDQKQTYTEVIQIAERLEEEQMEKAQRTLLLVPGKDAMNVIATVNNIGIYGAVPVAKKVEKRKTPLRSKSEKIEAKKTEENTSQKKELETIKEEEGAQLPGKTTTNSKSKGSPGSIFRSLSAPTESSLVSSASDLLSDSGGVDPLNNSSGSNLSFVQNPDSPKNSSSSSSSSSSSASILSPSASSSSSTSVDQNKDNLSMLKMLQGLSINPLKIAPPTPGISTPTVLLFEETPSDLESGGSKGVVSPTPTPVPSTRSPEVSSPTTEENTEISVTTPSPLNRRNQS